MTLIKNPDDHEAWYNQGVALYKLGKFKEAIDSYNKAIEIKPDYHDAWYARKALRDIIRGCDWGMDCTAWYEQGNVLRYQKAYETAISYYNKAIKLNPEFYEAWYNRGIALYKLERYGEAIASFDKAVEIKPDYHDAWNNRELALHKLGKNKEAIASFDKTATTHLNQTPNNK